MCWPCFRCSMAGPANSCADRRRTVKLFHSNESAWSRTSASSGIQLAPLVDVLLLLLIFFCSTWNAARTENELDVKVPKASAARRRLRQLVTLSLT